MKKSVLFPVFFVFFLNNFGFALVFPLYGPLVLDPHFGMISAAASSLQKNILIGLLFASFPFAQFFGAPFLGDIADRFGRKKGFYCTLAGMFLSYALGGLAVWVENISLLIVSRFLAGLFAGSLGICFASIADYSIDPKSRSANYGIIATLGAVGWVLALILSTDLSDPKLIHYLHPAIPFWLIAFLSILSLLAVAFFFKETNPTKKIFHLELVKSNRHVLVAWQDKKLRPYYLALFFFILGLFMSLWWFPSFSLERFNVTQQEIMLALIAYGIVWSVGSSLINSVLLKRYTIAKITLTGMAILALVLFVNTFIGSFFLFSACFVFGGLFASFCWANTANLISLHASTKEQGIAMGISQAVGALARVLGPLVGSAVAWFDLRAFYFFAALFILAAFSILILKRSSLKML